jgi:hypothetical protein
MIFPSTYAAPLLRLNACCGSSFVIDNVAKRSFGAKEEKGS